jgi:hypothetical protein
MPRESGLLAKAAGFEIVKDYGGNHFDEYKIGDWKRVLVLKKKLIEYVHNSHCVLLISIARVIFTDYSQALLLTEGGK